MRIKLLMLITLSLVSLKPSWANQDTRAFREATKKEQLTLYGKASKKALPKKFSILSWNMLTGLKPAWQEEFGKLIEGRDLVFLQETYFDKAKKDIFNSNHFLWVTATAHVHIKSDIPSGTAVGTQVEASKKEVLFSKYYEPIMNVKQSAVIATYPIEGKKEKLLVVNVHGINFVDDLKYFEQFLGIEKKIRNHKGPIIFGGDLNTSGYTKQKFINLIVQKHSLKEVEFNPDTRRKFMSYPLDHLYVRGIKIISSKVIETPMASDHNALSAEMEIE